MFPKKQKNIFALLIKKPFEKLQQLKKIKQKNNSFKKLGTIIENQMDFVKKNEIKYLKNSKSK